MSHLEDFIDSIGGFSDWNHAQKITFFVWYLHSLEKKADVTSSDVRRCYEELNLAKPSSVGPFLDALASRKPPDAIKTSAGYRLERRVRENFERQYGTRPATIYVDRLLADLPSKIPNVAEKAYLEEALLCFRHKAFRAAVVMSWNLAFDHLCNWVLTNHLAAFNIQLPKSFPKADISSIAKPDDFGVLKESQVLQVCKSANIISTSLHNVLKGKLERRNAAAHPSGVETTLPTAEEFIKDLIENVVLKLK